MCGNGLLVTIHKCAVRLGVSFMCLFSLKGLYLQNDCGKILKSRIEYGFYISAVGERGRSVCILKERYFNHGNTFVEAH